MLSIHFRGFVIVVILIDCAESERKVLKSSKEVITNTLVTTSITISEMEEGGGDRALENLVSAVQGHLRVESLAASGATKNRLLHFWKPVKPGLDTSKIFSVISFLGFLGGPINDPSSGNYYWSLSLLPEDFHDI